MLRLMSCRPAPPSPPALAGRLRAGSRWLLYNLRDLIGGGGVYHRPITVTTPSVGYVPGYCNPYWYVCVQRESVPVNTVIGNRSSTDFGIDVGGGMTFVVDESVTFYVEARYHYIWGPKVTNPATQESLRANAKFLPITLGFRF